MSYHKGMHYLEHEDDDIERFTLIDVSETQVRIAEARVKGDGRQRWDVYWTPIEELKRREALGNCEYVGNVTNEQLARITELAVNRYYATA